MKLLKINRNNKNIIILISSIICLFIIIGFFISLFNKKYFDIENVDAQKYVKLDTVSLKFNSIRIKEDDEKKYLVLIIDCKDLTESSDDYNSILDTQIYINSKLLDCDRWKSAIDINTKNIEMWYYINDDIEVAYNEGNFPNIIYPVKLYSSIIENKSIDSKIYRLVGVI